MSTIKIAILREEKIPQDTRTPITPSQAKYIQDKFPSIDICCQSSDIRCYADQEYQREGIKVLDDVGHCDVFFGVKEVKIESLIPGKTYFIFSHTLKKQPYNRQLLQSIVEKKIRLIDYECLTDEKGLRVIAFGRWAGIVGAYNALWTYGRKYGSFSLKRAHQCKDLKELFVELKKAQLPPVKIVITGNGRVANGGLEILNAVGFRRVDPEQYLFQQFDEPVYTQVDADIYTKRKDGREFRFDHFFKQPDQYKSNFKTFTKTSDILIMAAYWDPRAPRLFELQEVKEDSFKIRVIADITCDINGSVPTTKRPTTIEDPVYDVDLKNLSEFKAFADEDRLSVMSIDNLPNELPRDASGAFGEQLIENIIPSLMKGFGDTLIKQATITEQGELTKRFEYLQDYLDGKQ